VALGVAALGCLHLDAILLVGAHAVVVVLPMVAEARVQSAQRPGSVRRTRAWVGELATFVAGTTAIGRPAYGGDCGPCSRRRSGSGGSVRTPNAVVLKGG
jgi:hypothetical protein